MLGVIQGREHWCWPSTSWHWVQCQMDAAQNMVAVNAKRRVRHSGMGEVGLRLQGGGVGLEEPSSAISCLLHWETNRTQRLSILCCKILVHSWEPWLWDLGFALGEGDKSLYLLRRPLVALVVKLVAIVSIWAPLHTVVLPGIGSGTPAGVPFPDLLPKIQWPTYVTNNAYISVYLTLF